MRATLHDARGAGKLLRAQVLWRCYAGVTLAISAVL